MIKQNAQKRRGFTLTELAIVLGIMGTILGAIWGASARVSANNKVQKAEGQILTILGNFRTLYANKPIDVTVVTDFTCLGVNAGFFPSDMLPGVACVTDAGAFPISPVPAGEPTYPQTPWGGTTYVQVLVEPLNNGFNIRYNNLTQAACIALASSNTPPDLVVENVSGTTVDLPPVGTGTLLTSAQIAAACTLPDGSNYMHVIYPVR